MNQKNPGIVLRTALLAICCVIVAGCENAGTWQRREEPVLENYYNMYNPCVVETDGPYRYKMWFFGWARDLCNPGFPGCDAIYHARSRNLVDWEVYCGPGVWDATMSPHLWRPVLAASGRWYDGWHNGDPSVVEHEGRFYMAYSATSEPFAPREGYFASMVCCVMGAVSEDGITWRRSDRPLLFREQDTWPPAGDADRVGDFHRPSLMREDGKWKLWFDYMIPEGRTHLGYAVNRGDFMSPGGFVVQNDLAQPLLKDWPNPSVIKYNGVYHCFSDPPGYPLDPAAAGDPQARPWLTRQLCEAVSSDGMNWRRVGYIAPDSDADACHVPEALLHEEDGQRFLYLFYATQRGYKDRENGYDYKYDRIRFMKRRIFDESRAAGGGSALDK